MANLATNISNLLSAVGNTQNKDAKKAKDTAEDFESVFITDFLNTMTQNIGQDTGFDGGDSEGQWRSIMNEHTARSIAKSGGIGLSSGIMDSIIKAQAGAL